MKGRIIAIALVFMVTLGLMIGGLYAKGMMVETREKMFEKYDYADLEVSVGDADESALREIKNQKGVGKVEGRLILHGLIKEPSNIKPIIFVGIDPQKSKMNTYTLKRGVDELRGNNILLVGKNPDFEVGEDLKAKLVGNESTFHVSGHVRSAEYAAVPPVPGSSIPTPGNTAVAYVNLDLLQKISSIRYNNILVSYEKDADKKEVKNQIREISEKYGFQGITEREDEYIYQIFESAIEEEEKVIPIISAIFSTIGAVLIIVVISKIILSQQKEMGVLMAMGYSKKKLISSYLGFGGIFGLITGILGGILGIFVGYMWAGYGLKIFMDIKVVTKFSIFPFILSIGVGIGLVLVAVLISVYRINDMNALEAMRSQESEETFLKFDFGQKVNSISKFSLRNIIRRPKRVIALIIVLSLTIGISGSWLVMMDSMVDQAEDWEDHQNWDLQVTFSRPVRDEKIDKISKRFSGEIDRYETYTLSRGEVDGENVQMLGIPKESEMIDFIKLDGDIEYGRNRCIITNKLSNKLGKKVGDSITVKTVEKDIKLKVSAIVNDLRGNTIFLSQKDAREISGMENLSSGIYVKTNSRVSEAKRNFYDVRGVSYVISSSDFDDSMSTMVENMKGLLYFMFWINLSLLIVTVITVSLINVLERKSEYALLEMLGYRKRDSAKSIFQEIITIGIISIIVGVPSIYGFSLILRNIYSDLIFYYPLTITVMTISIIIASCLVFFLLSMISPIRAIQKSDIAEALRERSIE